MERRKGDEDHVRDTKIQESIILVRYQSYAFSLEGFLRTCQTWSYGIIVLDVEDFRLHQNT